MVVLVLLTLCDCFLLLLVCVAVVDGVVEVRFCCALLIAVVRSCCWVLSVVG